mgnify:CR=1 FL=1
MHVPSEGSFFTRLVRVILGTPRPSLGIFVEGKYSGTETPSETRVSDYQVENEHNRCQSHIASPTSRNEGSYQHGMCFILENVANITCLPDVLAEAHLFSAPMIIVPHHSLDSSFLKQVV